MSKEQRSRRLLVAGALAVAGAALVYLAFGGIGENLVYYWSPSELEAARGKAVGATIRLGGLVAPGTIERGGDGLSLSFGVTDGKTTVPVHARAVPPAMFREGIGVVVEGTLRPDGAFDTTRLMVKHDNEYRAPGEGEPKSMEELVKTLKLEGSGG